jgi:hypothetical protein
MDPFLVGLIAAWGLVTGALVVLIICRARLESKETDWIPLTEDAREERAIHEQAAIAKKAHKLDWPIRVLGTLSLILLFAAIGYWIYAGLSSPTPPSE